jgi:hypothetical protein
VRSLVRAIERKIWQALNVTDGGLMFYGPAIVSLPALRHLGLEFLNLLHRRLPADGAPRRRRRPPVGRAVSGNLGSIFRGAVAVDPSLVGGRALSR